MLLSVVVVVELASPYEGLMLRLLVVVLARGSREGVAVTGVLQSRPARERPTSAVVVVGGKSWWVLSLLL